MTITPDLVNHPPHYQNAGHGIAGEPMQYAPYLDGIRFSAFRYAWRAGFKWDTHQDIEKALVFVTRDVTHGSGLLFDKPGHLTYQLANGTPTLRRRVLVDLWTRHDLTPTIDALTQALNNPARLDEEI